MAAPVSVSTFNANPTPGNNFYQFNYNVAAGSDRLLVIQLTMANTVGYSGCTYDGVAMTQLHSTNRGGLSQRMAFFYLLNPNTGNNTLRINFTGNQWNPISIHVRNFTGSSGIGNEGRTGAQTTPNTQTLTVSQDSRIMATACSINVVSTIQIPQGSNRTFATHNTNRQVGTGAISAAAGLAAGTYNIRTTSTFGSVTNDRVEILGLGATPTLTVSTASLTNFDYVEGSGPSAEQTFTVSGDDLTADCTVTAPANYEVSTTSGSGFGASVVLGRTGTDLTGEPVTIYIRLQAGLTAGNYGGVNATCSSTGATSQTISLDGDVSPAPSRRRIIIS